MTNEVPTHALRQKGEHAANNDVAQRLAEEMAQCWQMGQRPLAEEFLARHPEVAKDPEAAIRLIYAEVCLREELGETLPAERIMGRFPQWRAQLAVLLDCHRLLDAPAPPTARTSVGEFTMLSELGHGVQGRVYLARQPALADRLVVLKITPCTGQEHLTLARLQHTNIMPLYAVQDDPQRNLRTLCMPYFGGAAFNRVLHELRRKPVAERTGRDVLTVLERAAARAPDLETSPSLNKGPLRQFLAKASYGQAVCWIGACLADGLHYAHERELVHLDLKPENVLLAADGQPMLLDFHVAHKPIKPGGPLPEWLGGTPAYMAPEHEALMTAMKRGGPIPALVDGRADIFSLGLLLYEALGGTIPLTGPHTLVALRRRNPLVSVGLCDLLAKCLAANPLERYSTAAALAVDLRRHVHDLPLHGVRNRSMTERWHKWRRRRPHALMLTMMGLLVVAATLAVGAVAYERVGQQRRDAEAALVQGQQQFTNRSYAQAVETLTQGLALAGNLPGDGELARQLDVQLRRAQRALTAEQLHGLADRLRFLCGASTLPQGTPSSLASHWNSLWSKRAMLHDKGNVALDAQLEERLETDLIDLGLIWADLRVRLAEPADVAEARREALQILADTESLFGPSHVLYRLRQEYAAALGQDDVARTAARRAAELPPQSAWEHYALGRSLLQSGDLDRAAATLSRAIDLQPQDFWPHFHQGVCAFRRQRFEDALASFSVGIALAPKSSECYYNRALAEAKLGRAERALADYDRALQLDPDMAAALLNRGLLHFGQKHYGQALADLRLALAHGGDAATIHFNIALVYLEQQNRPAALASLRHALQADSHHKAARALLDRLQR